MILITCWMIGYVFILMGYELMVLIMKFGLIWEVLELLVKNECGDENLLFWCYEFIFWCILMFFVWMLTVGEICATFLGQLGLKLRFWGKSCVSSREEPKNLGSLSCDTRPTCPSSLWQDVYDRTNSFGRSRQLRSLMDIHNSSFWCV